MKIKYCIRSMRLRTLPLSLAGVSAGTLLAARDFSLDPVTVCLLALTTVSLQILSNLSNELGDYLSGTDTEDRQGIRYSLQDGGLGAGDMRKLIIGAASFAAVSGALMIRSAFGTWLGIAPAFFLLLGAAAIWAAVHYTLGKNPYGYRGLGDVFVFIFFGLATVLGSYTICSASLPAPQLLLPAAAIGCFSVGVLNVNNIRDMVSDAATRTTMAIRLGKKRARIYQTVLIAGGWCFALCYTLLQTVSLWIFLYFATLPLYCIHLRGVWHREDSALDPMLPLLVLSSFVFAVLFGAGFLIG